MQFGFPGICSNYRQLNALNASNILSTAFKHHWQGVDVRRGGGGRHRRWRRWGVGAGDGKALGRVGGGEEGRLWVGGRFGWTAACGGVREEEAARGGRGGGGGARWERRTW
uniref:Uncharacterized protein n=1 Tax=Oryza glumipatula TaxID=40148 RepID=A0A0D9ZI51_9ORYZ